MNQFELERSSPPNHTIIYSSSMPVPFALRFSIRSYIIFRASSWAFERRFSFARATSSAWANPTKLCLRRLFSNWILHIRSLVLVVGKELLTAQRSRLFFSLLIVVIVSVAFAISPEAWWWLSCECNVGKGSSLRASRLKSSCDSCQHLKQNDNNWKYRSDGIRIYAGLDHLPDDHWHRRVRWVCRTHRAVFNQPSPPSW